MRIIMTCFVGCLFILISGCKEKESSYFEFTGPTMGTKYNITAQTDSPELLKNAIDSILSDFNTSMSLYIDSSTLSLFNAADSMYCFDPQKDPYFEPIFIKSKEVYKLTGGAFDPSIAPLVNYYGFGYKEKKKLSEVDTIKVANLLSLLVFDTLQLSKNAQGEICIWKPKKEVKLDFNALSPGYAVDVIADFFTKKGIRNFMINLGGEIRSLGLNDRQKDWVIGINKPTEGALETEIELPLMVSNKSLATSGNYRNAYESKGQKFAHIINPFTGMSQPTDILSATVIADDCISADAYATAFMVLGLEKSLLLVEQLKGIDACFIYDTEGDGIFEFKVSEGFSRYYLNNEQH
ncbi:MAG: FAD:protein FMN transferase [Saprospiraceae bacterium]|nr:FAD:protein FMN transferase [Saprospiraceae bacterium]